MHEPYSSVCSLLIIPFFSSIRDLRATGVEFTYNSKFLPDAPTTVQSVRARKLVLVCAGTFGSPGVLERSGIGARETLDKVGVPVKIDLPGVGENYQGEHSISLFFYSQKMTG
jgi:alcohol oxidase